MKSIYKTTFIFISLITIAISGFSSGSNKYLPDTIRMQMPNNTTIEIMTQFKGKMEQLEKAKVNLLLNEFFKMWNVLKTNDLENGQSMHIVCDTKIDNPHKHKKSISIKEFFKQTKLVFPSDSNQILYLKGKHKLEFNQAKYNITIHFNTIKQLEELKAYNFHEILKNADTEIILNKQTCSRTRSLVVWLNVNKEFSVNQITHTISGVNNFFYATLGTGLNNVKGHWNASFFGSLTYVHRNSLKPLMAISYIYEYMYDFSETNHTNINVWQGLKYAINVSPSNQKTDWVGLSVEYLAKPKGDLFKDNSFRIGFEKSLYDNISIVPQMYFNDFFKNVYPGINIKVNI